MFTFEQPNKQLKIMAKNTKGLTFRDKQRNTANTFYFKVQLYNELHNEIYKILKDRTLNIALLSEQLGTDRNTAYYRIKKQVYKPEDLELLAKKAIELYK
jgi:transcriptional regulator of acetoin/glycerol metabolism